jgi:hypothetical protein
LPWTNPEVCNPSKKAFSRERRNPMIEKERMIEDFFNSISFRERIIIGMYDEGRLYFSIDFSEELANGLMTSAFLDDKIYHGLKELISNLESILDGVERYKPTKAEEIH